METFGPWLDRGRGTKQNNGAIQAFTRKIASNVARCRHSLPSELGPRKSIGLRNLPRFVSAGLYDGPSSKIRCTGRPIVEKGHFGQHQKRESVQSASGTACARSCIMYRAEASRWRSNLSVKQTSLGGWRPPTFGHFIQDQLPGARRLGWDLGMGMCGYLLVFVLESYDST